MWSIGYAGNTAFANLAITRERAGLTACSGSAMRTVQVEFAGRFCRLPEAGPMPHSPKPAPHPQEDDPPARCLSGFRGAAANSGICLQHAT